MSIINDINVLKIYFVEENDSNDFNKWHILKIDAKNIYKLVEFNLLLKLSLMLKLLGRLMLFLKPMFTSLDDDIFFFHLHMICGFMLAPI